jgi:glycosyltransferase involved in cell wall biosynthesis
VTAGPRGLSLQPSPLPLRYTPPVPGVTVTIITRNEAAHIEAALRSVAWADERIVVDAESTDGTAALAEPLADRVVVRGWPGYADQKNYAASLATHDWILSLDADERVTPALAGHIRAELAAPSHQGYRIARVTWYLGRWIRSTDWYPDWQLRLYDRRAGRWQPRRVHESVAVEGSVGRLRGELQHFAYRDLSHHLATIDRYTTLAAADLADAGRRTGPGRIAAHTCAAFLRNYALRGGVRDGTAGLLVSLMNTHYVFLKLAKLWERQQGSSSHSGGVSAPGAPEAGPVRARPSQDG